MKKFLQFILLTSSTFTFVQSYAQVDTSAIDHFLQKQIIAEEDFLTFLEAGKTDSCLKYFSPAVIKKHGIDSLKKEIQYLTSLLSKFPNPKQTFTIGGSFQGVGTFGHDVDGRFEKQSLYQFLNADSIVYSFTLYYSDRDPVSLIKFYESQNLMDYRFKNMKPLIPNKPVRNTP